MATNFVNLRAYHLDLLLDKEKTYLTADAAIGTSLTVEAITGIGVGDYLLLGEFGQETAEIVRVSTSAAPSGNGITLNATSVEAHNRGDSVYRVDRNQVEFSRATTLTGTKTTLTTDSIVPQELYSVYDDVANTTGFGFYRFAKSMTVTLTAAGTTATATSAGHGLVTGESITISGADQTEYNITAAVTVTNATTFTYTIAAGAVSPATGTITGRSYSNYSESIPYAGYGEQTLKKIFDSALFDLGYVTNKGQTTFTDKISREATFQAVMDCQNELAALRYRWSYLTNFNVNISEITTGDDSYTLPDAIAREDGQAMVLAARIGGNKELKYVDKRKLNEWREDIVQTTLGAAITATTQTTVTLTDSSDFTDSGNIQVVADNEETIDTISYTANDRSTNVLSGVTEIAATKASGNIVWQGATFSEPKRYTIFEDTIILDPPPAPEWEDYNLIADIYEKPTLIDDLADEAQFPAFVLKPYVTWKLALLRYDGDTSRADPFRLLYEQRKAELLVNENNGQRFRFSPNRKPSTTTNLKSRELLDDTSTISAT